VAEEYPGTVVMGMDLAPIQPRDIPENCGFVVGDLTVDLEDYDDASMDLVHSRYPLYTFIDERFLHAGVTRDKWPKYINEVFRCLQPDTGWIQCCEMAAWTFENCEDSIFPEANKS
jgi:hypothetical protein